MGARAHHAARRAIRWWQASSITSRLSHSAAFAGATFTKVDNSFKRLRFTQNPGGVRVTVKTLKGKLENPAACQAVSLEASRTRLQATMQEYSFSAEVPK